MSITNTKRKKQYELSGAFPTEFPIDFPYWDESEIYAIITKLTGDVDLDYLIDFTLSPPDGLSGTLTRVTDWTDAIRLTIYREVSRTQEVDIAGGDIIDPEVNEGMADHAIAAIIEIAEETSRSMILPITDTGAEVALPVAEERANKFLAFDETGAPIASPGAAGGYPVSGFMATVLDDEDAATARATLGVNKTNMDTLGIAAATAEEADLAATAMKIRTEAPETPEDGEIWMV